MIEPPFVVASDIEAASKLVRRFPLSQLRLMNDARFPWLLLVPERTGLEEWTDLAPWDLQQLSLEIRLTVALLKQAASPDKINVASLGNIVRQLHVHVVGRKVGDAAWPGPVWGCGTAVPYTEDAEIFFRKLLQ